MHPDAGTIISVTARPVLVPFRRPVQTASFVIPEVPLILIDIQTSSGVIGRSYVMAYGDWAFRPLLACIQAAAEMMKGQNADPKAINTLLRKRMMLVGTSGAIGIAIGGIDNALWDAVAQARDVSLVTLLGGTARPVKAYNSGGLWMKPVAELLDEATELLDEGGFQGLKIRLGRADPREDLDVVQRIRDRVGEDIALMADFNQSLTTENAILRGRMLDGEGLEWIEDPIPFADLEGHTEITAALKTPVQTGENFYAPMELERAIRMNALNLAMPDATLIGGVTGWLASAAIAQDHNIPLSSHINPEVTRHLMPVTPTAHWMEFTDWVNPLLMDPIAVTNGYITAPDGPGVGIAWDEAAVKRYLA